MENVSSQFRSQLPVPQTLGGWCVYMDSLSCKFLEMFLGNDGGELTQQIFMHITHEADTILAPSGLLEPELEDSYRDIHLCPVLKAPWNTPEGQVAISVVMRIDKAMGWGPQVCMVRRNVIEKLMLQQRAEWGASLRRILSSSAFKI